MNTVKEELEALLEEQIESLKLGSSALIKYAAERREHLARSIAAGCDDVAEVAKIEMLNVKTYAMTEAVRQADKVDAAMLSSALMLIGAFDKLLLASLG